MRCKLLDPLVILIIFVIGLFLSGCSVAPQLHQKLIVQAIGLDLEDNICKVTLQALDFQNPAGENSPTTKLVELEGDTLSQALEQVTNKTGLIPMYSQNLIIVLGSTVAYSGVNNFTDFFIRHYEARPNVKICVSESKAHDVLNCGSDNGIMSAKDIQNLIPNDLNSDILHFISNLESEISDPYCAYLSLDLINGKKEVNMTGTAIFKGDKLVKIIQKDDYKALSLVLRMGNIGTYNVESENTGTSTVNITKNCRQIYVNSLQNKEFTLDIKLNSTLLQVDKSKIGKLTNDYEKEIENALAASLAQSIKNVIKELINLDSDIFGFGKILLKSNPEYFKNLGHSSQKEIRSFSYNVNVMPNISVTGTAI